LKQRTKSSGFKVRHSLFRKYLTFGLMILLVSFIALSVMMYIFVNSYWEREKKKNLIDNATRVASFVNESSRLNSQSDNLLFHDYTQGDFFGLTINTISKSIDADIFIVDTTGSCEYCSEGSDCIHHTTPIPSSVLGVTAQTKEFFESGTLDGYYGEVYYTAGVPIMADDGETIIAFCYASAHSTFGAELPLTFMKIFLAAAAITLAIVIVFVASMSYSMVRPLRQMSSAAKKFAVGDFSVRVPVKSDNEIGELANAFNYMADSLSSSEGMRRTFIANVSHELKTPMTTIAGFIDGMLDGTIPPERQRHYMTIVSNEVKRLSRLVTSMLSLSRIDNGELKIHPADFDLFSTLISILSGFEQKIRERKLDIIGLEDFRSIKVYADPDLIYQVVYNLIENAVKFTDEGGSIHFGVEETPYDISIMITNTGSGIPPEDIRFIFDRFYKTDKSRSMDKKGMGLGLFIAKTIMRLHGGDIYVESRVNEFTRFTFRLPTNIPRHDNTASDKTHKYIETTADSKTEE